MAGAVVELSVKVAGDAQRLLDVQLSLLGREFTSAFRSGNSVWPLWHPPTREQLERFCDTEHERTSIARHLDANVKHEAWVAEFIDARKGLDKELRIEMSGLPSSARTDAEVLSNFLGRLYALFPSLSFFPSDMISVDVDLKAAFDWSISATHERLWISGSSQLKRRRGKAPAVTDIEHTKRHYQRVLAECRALRRRVKNENLTASMCAYQASRVLNKWGAQFLGAVHLGRQRAALSLKHRLLEDQVVDVDWAEFVKGRWQPNQLAKQLVAAQHGLSEARLSDILRRRKIQKRRRNRTRVPNRRGR